MRLVFINEQDFSRREDWIELLNKLGINDMERSSTLSVCFDVYKFLYHVDTGGNIETRTGRA